VCEAQWLEVADGEVSEIVGCVMQMHYTTYKKTVAKRSAKQTDQASTTRLWWWFPSADAKRVHAKTEKEAKPV
jgi:hypothetical protein